MTPHGQEEYRTIISMNADFVRSSMALEEEFDQQRRAKETAAAEAAAAAAVAAEVRSAPWSNAAEFRPTGDWAIDVMRLTVLQ